MGACLLAAVGLAGVTSTGGQSAGAATAAPTGYQRTLAAVKAEAAAAASAAKAASDKAAAADGAYNAALTVLANAKAKASAALKTAQQREAAFKAAKTSAAKATAKSQYNASVGAKHNADAAVVKATNTARDRRIDASVEQGRATKANAAAASLADRIVRLRTMYGSDDNTSFTKLQNNYTFTGTRPSKTWSVYNSSHTGKPYLRNPGYVSVIRNNLAITTYHRTGAGVCLCGKGAYPTKPYGRWEVRLRIDRNKDHGPAVLLWPNSEKWPEDGELDLAEFNPSRTKVAFAIHYDSKNLQKQTYTAGDFRQWHTFRLDWNSRGLAYYIDGKLIAITVDKAVIPTKPMHMSIENGPNSVRQATKTSSRLDISSVKVYAP